MAGKGSKRRPLSVNTETFNDNWDNIFRKDKPKPEEVKFEPKEVVQISRVYSSVREAVVKKI